MASFVYNEGAEEISKGAVVYTSDTIKAALIAESVMASLNKDDTDLTHANYTGANRIGTDQTLANKSIVKNTTDDRVQFQQGTMLTWSAVSGPQVGGILIYEDDTTDIPLCLIDLTTPVTPNGGDLTWTPASNIVFYLQQ